jgi:hypothetical protein
MSGFGLAKKGLGLLGRKLKHQIKRTKKIPDKRFKHVNLDTVKHKNPRTGKIQNVQSQKLVKGSKGKKNYINKMKEYTFKSIPKDKN